MTNDQNKLGLRNHGIDLFRLIGAFFIIIIHCDFENLDARTEGGLVLMGRWAVPFYFMTSGYFLGRRFLKKGTFDFSLIGPSLVKLMSIFFVASLFYLQDHFEFKVLHMSMNNVTTGFSFHLWFLTSLISGLLFIWYINAIGRPKLLPWISIGVLLLAILTDKYDVLIGKEIPFLFLRYLTAIPFLFIGMQLAIGKINVSRNWSLILLSLGLVLQFVESTLFLEYFQIPRTHHQISFGIILTTVGLFSFLIKNNWANKGISKIGVLGGNYALFIYIYHPFVLENQLTLIKTLGLEGFDLIKPLMSFCLLLLIAKVLDMYLKPIFKILNGEVVKK